MKNNKTVTFRVSEDLLRKFLYVAGEEGRTPNNHFLYMVRQNLAYYERTKGRIPNDRLANVDLSVLNDENDGEN